MTARPLLPMALGLAAGIALAPSWPWRAASAALAPLLALSPPLASLGMLCAGLAAARPAPAPPAPPGAREQVVDGLVASMPERSQDRVRFELRTSDGVLLDVTAPPPAWPLAWGDRVRLAAELRPPPPARNPGGRDRAARARARGVALEGFAREPPVRTAPPSPLGRLEAARTRFAELASGRMPAEEAGLVRALGAGDVSALAPATQEAFGRSGLAHLLSVSGLHLAVVALGLFRTAAWLLGRWDAVALRIDPRRAAAAVALPATLFYAVATGAQVPIVRSALGAAAAFLGVILDREGDALNTLSLAAIAILAAEPGALLDPSFQLSFASVAGLALLTGPLRRAIPLERGRGLAGRAREALLGASCASLAAALATAPIAAFHFRRLPVLAVPANLVGVPVGSALTVLAALAGLASAVAPPLAPALLFLCRPGAWLLLRINAAFAAPPWAALGVASPGLAGVLGCYAMATAALLNRGGLRRACAAAAVGALLLPGPLRAEAARQRGLLEVLFVSVGQGDAAVLRLPGGAAVLIDAGGEARGRYDPGARDIVPLLRDMGVRRLAAAFVSHPHADHLLGLPAVAAAMPIDVLYATDRRGDETAQAAWARLPPPQPIAAGMALTIDGVRFEVLGPPPGSDGFGENDASLVLRVVHGRTAFLFPGDVEGAGEAALLAAGRPVLSDVVKVPHHGSRTSSGAEFAAEVAPRWAVISLAGRNRFGFPHAEAVGRWRSAGAEVLRTDEGAARFLSDGRAVWRTESWRAIDAWALWQEGERSAGRRSPRGRPRG